MLCQDDSSAELECPEPFFNEFKTMKSKKILRWPSSNEVETRAWSPSRLRVKAVMESKPFDMLMGVIILVNLVLIVVETNTLAACQTRKEESCDVPSAVKIMNPILFAIYTVELLIRLFAYRGWFFHYYWHSLDFLVVASGIVDIALSAQQQNIPNLTAIRVFRLLRLARTLRLFRYFPELQTLLRGFGGAMKAMFWGFTIIILMLGLWSLLAVQFVHPLNQEIDHGVEEWCDEAFSSVEKSVGFFFQTLVAGDSWGTCTIPIMKNYPLTIPIFVLALVSVQLGFTNLILAVIVDAAYQAKERDTESRLQDKKQHERDCVELWRTVIEELDVDKSGSISIDELKQGYKERQEVTNLLGLLDIDWHDLETLYHLMDVDNSGEVSYVEFFHCLRKAQTQDVRIYLMNVKLQISHMTALLSKQIALIREGFRMNAEPSSVYGFLNEPANSLTVAAELNKAKNVQHVPPSASRTSTRLPTEGTPSFDFGTGKPTNADIVGHEDKVTFEEEAKPAARWASGEVMDVDLASHMESLDRLRTELEERLEDIAQTAAATAVTLAQNAKSLEALVASCASNAAPAALNRVRNSMASISREFGSHGRPPAGFGVLPHAVANPMRSEGASDAPVSPQDSAASGINI